MTAARRIAAILATRAGVEARFARPTGARSDRASPDDDAET